MKKIMLGMSGGVDSSAAALLLIERGFEVTGVTLLLRGGDDALRDVDDARATASRLGIEHRTVDLRQTFADGVIADFVSEYRSGRTPNPCIRCNEQIKFGAMLDYALQNGADGIATGHYAKIKKADDGRSLLIRSDSPKDQSYFLYRLNEFQLSHTVFPLENITDKDEVRAICENAGLSAARRGDSQEICFVPDDDYIAFLESRGVTAEKGDFVDTSGRVIGTHQGIIRYTVGQRKGLGAFGRPVFVTRIDAATNRVVLGDNGEQYSRGLIADSVNLIAMDALPPAFEAEVKIRFRARPEKALITPLPDGRFSVEFAEPQRSVTPGQAAVIYIGDTVVGGGRIIEQLP